jgi:2-hydroxy-3-oxopropionate reductase
VFGPVGVAAGAGPGKLLIDMSSIDPGATAQMAAELLVSTGMGWLDAPLSGGVPGALAGRLTVMAGGTSEDFERGRNVMQSLCANYTLMGASGAGQTTKLVNQLFCALLFQAVAEAVKLAEAGGVDPARIPAALAGGRADSRILQEFMAKFAARDFSPTGRIDNMLKDLDSVQAFALKTRTPLPLTGAVTEIHRILVAMGLGDKDSAEMMRLLDGR